MAFLNYDGLKRYDKKTKKYIEDKIKKLNDIDVDELVTKAELDTKANKSDIFSGDYNDLTNKPNIPDTANLAAKTDLTTHTNNANIHVTSAEKNTWNAKLDNSDLEDYATKTYVTDEIAKASTGGTIDLTGYAKTVDVNSALSTKVDKVSGKSLVDDTEISRLALVDNYDDTNIKSSITSINSKLNDKANKTDLFSGSYNDLTDKPTIPDISNLASKTELKNHTDNTNIHITTAERTKWNNKAEMSDIPSLTNYATKTYVTDEIAKASTSGTVDLTGYAKTTDVNSALNTKVDKVTGKSLVSDTEIERLKNVDNYDDTAIMESINSKANTTDLTTHTSDTNIHITTAERNKWNAVDNISQALKTTQSIEYGGKSITCRNTLESRTSDMLIKGQTNKNTSKIESAGEKENKISILSKNKESVDDNNYKQDKKEILLPVDGGLKSLPNNVADTIEQRNDGVYLVQRVGKVVLNGNERWDKSSWSMTNTFKFDFEIGLVAKLFDTNATNQILCDTFEVFSRNSLDNVANREFENICASNSRSRTLSITISKTKLNNTNTTGTFKQWLSNNPVTVCYELATPIETKLNIKNLDLEVYKDTTYIKTDNAIQPTLSFKVPSNIGGIIQANSQNINELYKLIDEVIIPQLINNSADIEVLKLK